MLNFQQKKNFNMTTDQFGIKIKTYEDYLMEQGAQGEAYEIARAGKWKERELFTNEDRAKLYQEES